jgi:hypothetical protein
VAFPTGSSRLLEVLGVSQAPGLFLSVPPSVAFARVFSRVRIADGGRRTKSDDQKTARIPSNAIKNGITIGAGEDRKHLQKLLFALLALLAW